MPSTLSKKFTARDQAFGRWYQATGATDDDRRDRGADAEVGHFGDRRQFGAREAADRGARRSELLHGARHSDQMADHRQHTGWAEHKDGVGRAHVAIAARVLDV